MQPSTQKHLGWPSDSFRSCRLMANVTRLRLTLCTMQYQKSNLALATLLMIAFDGTSIAADVFRPRGTVQYFAVDAAVLTNSPKWNPDDDKIQLTATNAIRAATKYHDSLRFTGFSRLHRWSFHRATLMSAGDDRWYWIVTFRGPYDPTLFKGPGGYSYPGARTLYNHYPILMTGGMPEPITESAAQKQSRRDQNVRDIDSGKPIFDYNGACPFPPDSD
jgi:hypothetical protein